MIDFRQLSIILLIFDIREEFLFYISSFLERRVGWQGVPKETYLAVKKQKERRKEVHRV